MAKEADASSLNKNDSFYDPLFTYGYGLTYKDNINLEDLSESLPSQRKSKLGEVFLQGWPTDQYRVILQSPSEAFLVEKTFYHKG